LVDLVYTVVNIINFLLAWAWLVCIFFITYSGFQMATSHANEEQLSSAKKGLDNAITGFFLIMVAYLLIEWAVGTLAGPKAPGAGAGFLQTLINTLTTLPK
jgi:ABC-type phosphate transport system permease subunit